MSFSSFCMDTWRELVRYLEDEELLACSFVCVDAQEAVLKEVKKRYSKNAGSLDNWWNYGGRCQRGSIHTCGHHGDNYLISYNHKTARWDIVEIRMHVCKLCFSYGLQTFTTRHGGAKPTLRAHGNEIRRLMIYYDPVSWFFDPSRQPHWDNKRYDVRYNS